MLEIIECCVASLALDNCEQNYHCQPLEISQTIHTVCCEDDYFPKGKFKLFNSFFHSALFYQKVGFLLPICLPCFICGSYTTKINAVL